MARSGSVSVRRRDSATQLGGFKLWARCSRAASVRPTAMAISLNDAPFALKSMRRWSSSSVHRFRRGVESIASELLANLPLAFKRLRRPRTEVMLLRSSAAIAKVDLPTACRSRSRLSTSGVHFCCFCRHSIAVPSKRPAAARLAPGQVSYYDDGVTATRRIGSYGRTRDPVVDEGNPGREGSVASGMSTRRSK
jgi:hypothetical protein